MNDDELFGKDHELILWLNECRKSILLTRLRKIGDKMGQYITSIRYCDILEWSYDYSEVRDTRDDKIVYSYYHSDCDYCKEYKERVRSNKIIGIKIYPKGVIAKRRDWTPFTG